MAAETAKMPLQMTLRGASREAFMWEEEATVLLANERSMTELSGVGTTLDRIIRQWGLKIAGGITEVQLEPQGVEIDSVNDKLEAEGVKVTVLRLTQVNLDPRGNIDMEHHSLHRLDLVVGCFHSALRKKDDQTERYLAALGDPDMQILGHPRGRTYNYRLGLSADWEQILGLAAKLDKAVEVDAYPDRQDLSCDLLAMAKKSGCRISLGTDAHDPLQLRFMDSSLASALRAGITPERILNFMTVQELKDWARAVRSHAQLHN